MKVRKAPERTLRGLSPRASTSPRESIVLSEFHRRLERGAPVAKRPARGGEGGVSGSRPAPRRHPPPGSGPRPAPARGKGGAPPERGGGVPHLGPGAPRSHHPACRRQPPP